MFSPKQEIMRVSEFAALNRAISEVLTQILEEQYTTLNQVGQKLGWEPTNIYKCARGDRPWPLWLLYGLCGELGISIGGLLREAEVLAAQKLGTTVPDESPHSEPPRPPGKQGTNQERYYNTWTQEEIDWLIEHYGKTHSARQCMDAVHKLLPAVYNKASQLGLRIGGNDWRLRRGPKREA